ncbi:hypothetical protein WM40_23260 [Robbsia andropogonis]|uniref:DUF883 domain-containing protein n=1 Tax=Robbsia andropogonis TaxID=28092 RepID=A0A0F5JUS9_9BURK|nr:DUF883 family protein [Robbsia andropogonis]KKB61430.1 hypothetical protein WM40_23260 [Robbsia andropogonis]MCP1120187.1 DUF883 family protein [Robbsia andropogonis]MCP1129981.1 DUF883 family protein [Robbsia andropogonis]
MGLFKSKSAQAADAALEQARELSAQAAAQATQAAARGQAAIDSGGNRLKQLLSELESLVTPKVEAALPVVRQRTDKVIARLNARGQDLSKDLQQAVGNADAYAKKNPWHIVGAAAGVALLIGFLAGRS